MTSTPQSAHLPILLAAVRQQRLDGELVLEQNDGVRRLRWLRGELVYLQSDAAGEQFGSYLLRQGILDFAGLNDLLANCDRSRLGERVIQAGVLTVEERDAHLRRLQEQVMINALEHPILQLAWNPDAGGATLSEDLHLAMDHRHFVWSTFLEAHNLDATFDLLQSQSEWAWEGIPGLLDALSDLPLNPATAYALSFLGCEPISFDTFLSLSGLHEEEAARIFLILWAVGALTLTQGELPSLTMAAAPQPSEAQAGPVANPRIERDPGRGTARPSNPPAEEPAPPAGSAEPSPRERARSLFRKARQHQAQEHIGEAIQCLEQSLQLDPDSDHAYAVWLLLGNLRMSNPAWAARAINAFQSASRIQPRAAEPWIGTGVIYYRKGFRTNALTCFQKAQEFDPAAAIPDEVDFGSLQGEPPEPPPAESRSLFNRFRSALGDADKG